MRPQSVCLLLLRETQFIVTGITFIAIIYLRSIHSIYFGLGSLVATASAKLIKRCIRQPRPIESTKSSYGMPSTHSSSISYFGTYLTLNSLMGKIYYLHYREGNWMSPAVGHESVLREFYHRVGGMMFVFLAALVCWSRVKLGHHTPLQVLAGALIGASIGWIWFGLWSGFRLPSSVPALWNNQEWIVSEGYGDRIEYQFDEFVSLLLEAWRMRDGGLIWDGLARPALNSVASQLGHDNWISNGLATSEPTFWTTKPSSAASLLRHWSRLVFTRSSFEDIHLKALSCRTRISPSSFFISLLTCISNSTNLTTKLAPFNFIPTSTVRKSWPHFFSLLLTRGFYLLEFRSFYPSDKASDRIGMPSHSPA